MIFDLFSTERVKDHDLCLYHAGSENSKAVRYAESMTEKTSSTESIITRPTNCKEEDGEMFIQRGLTIKSYTHTCVLRINTEQNHLIQI